jgi:hypothetical protein
MTEPKQFVLAWLAASGERRRALVPMVVGQEGATAFLPEPLPIGRTVWMEQGPAERCAFVRSCQSASGQWVVDLCFLVEERRRQDRIPVSGKGEVHWYDKGGHQRVATVEVENVTESGVRLKVAESLRGVAMLRLTGETWECLGRIRYSEAGVTGHGVGIELASPAYLKESAEYFD